MFTLNNLCGNTLCQSNVCLWRHTCSQPCSLRMDACCGSAGTCVNSWIKSAADLPAPVTCSTHSLTGAGPPGIIKAKLLNSSNCHCRLPRGFKGCSWMTTVAAENGHTLNDVHRPFVQYFDACEPVYSPAAFCLTESDSSMLASMR